MNKVLFLLLALFLACPGGAGANPARTPQAVGKDLTIAGPMLASPEQAVNLIKSINPKPKLNCSVEEIVRLYYKEAGDEGIRPDVALSQALLETGYFRYGGAVEAWQNNFCGLGSVSSSAKGASFATPELGVRAHIQHLLAYSSKRQPKTKIVDPRYDMVRKRPDISGVCVTWEDLNGRWAQGGVPYGERIRAIHQRMLATEPKHRPAMPPVKAEPAEPEKPPEKERAENTADQKKPTKNDKKQKDKNKDKKQGANAGGGDSPKGAASGQARK